MGHPAVRKRSGIPPTRLCAKGPEIPPTLQDAKGPEIPPTRLCAKGPEIPPTRLCAKGPESHPPGCAKGQESHPRQWVVHSNPFLNKLRCWLWNPTNGSWWIGSDPFYKDLPAK